MIVKIVITVFIFLELSNVLVMYFAPGAYSDDVVQ